MGRSEAPLLQREVRGLSPRREGEKAPEELVIAGCFALLQERLGMIGVFNLLAPIVPSGMAGTERVVARDTPSIRRGCERQGGAGRVGGAGRAVGRQGHATWPGGADRRHGGAIAWMQRQGVQRRPLGGPSCGWSTGPCQRSAAVAAFAPPGRSPTPPHRPGHPRPARRRACARRPACGVCRCAQTL
jgi:hypothetical protein